MDVSKLIKSFDGEADSFETWLDTFYSAMRLRGLNLAFPAYADKRKEGYDLVAAQEKIYDFLCLCIDKTSLNIIRRSAKDNGVKAVEELKKHYLRDSDQRLHKNYHSFITMKMGEDDVAQFLIRIEDM